MGCGTGLIKYLVFIFNLIFAVAGLVLLVAGVLYQLNLGDATRALKGSAVAVGPTVVIAIGAIIFIISFFGCCGAVRESTCMLTTYAVILLVIFILQIGIGVFCFLQIKDNNGDYKTEIRNELQETFNRYNSDKSAEDAFNLVQHSMKCCGVSSPKDWGSSRLPASCCEQNKNPCNIADRESFDEGCATKVYHSIKDNTETLGYIALGLCATELIAAIFSLCLSSSIRNEERRRGMYA